MKNLKLDFQCTEVQYPKEFPGTEEVKLKLVGGDAHLAVPQGELNLRLTKPEAAGTFESSKTYSCVMTEQDGKEKEGPVTQDSESEAEGSEAGALQDFKPKTRCKATVSEITESEGEFWNEEKQESEKKKVFNISFMPVYSGSAENKAFFAATPTMQFNLGTVNESAAANFEKGKEYYIDITAAN